MYDLTLLIHFPKESHLQAIKSKITLCTNPGVAKNDHVDYYRAWIAGSI